jgi:hypothetical protein
VLLEAVLDREMAAEAQGQGTTTPRHVLFLLASPQKRENLVQIRNHTPKKQHLSASTCSDLYALLPNTAATYHTAPVILLSKV